MVVAVLGVALIVALASTLAPAIRAARSSTVSALADSARPPRRHGALISLSSGLPVPALFGLRMAARRPRRALLSAASIAVTVAGIVTALAFHATVDASVKTIGGSSGGLADPVVSRDEQLLTGDHDHAGHTGGPERDPHGLGHGTGRQAPGSADARARRASARSVGLVAAQVLSALPGAIWASRWASCCSRPWPAHQTALPSALWVVAACSGPSSSWPGSHRPGPDWHPHPDGVLPPVRNA